MKFDCIVVGAGPTGAVLTALLGRAGHSVLVLERDAEVYPLPRAVHLDHEIMRVLQQLGVIERFAPHSSYVDDYIFQNAAGEALLEVRGGGELANSGYLASTMFVQPELEAILRTDLLDIPTVDARFGAAVTDLVANDGVKVRFTHLGVTHEASARYVVGCDGASSFVRRALAVPMDDLGFDEPWVVVDTRMKRDIGLPAAHGLPVLRSEAADHVRSGGPRPTPLGIHAAAGRIARDAGSLGERLAIARTVGR